MRRVSGGYTIIEVMIVLAVTGLLFLSATMLFQGQQGKTQFTDANRDLQSNILDWSNDVATGFYPIQNNASGGKGYICSFFTLPASANGGVKLSYAPAGQTANGTNEGCLYIGKVIQIKPDDGTVKIYTIIGKRTITVSGVTRPVLNLQESEPTVARNNYPSGTATGIDLTESYSTLFGASPQTIPAGSCTATTSTCPTYAVAIYNTFSNNAIGSTASDSVKMYALSSQKFDFTTTEQINQCVHGSSPGGLPANSCSNDPLYLNPRQLSKWRICLKSTSSKQFADINLTSTGDAINSQIVYVDGC